MKRTAEVIEGSIVDYIMKDEEEDFQEFLSLVLEQIYGEEGSIEQCSGDDEPFTRKQCLNLVGYRKRLLEIASRPNNGAEL